MYKITVAQIVLILSILLLSACMQGESNVESGSRDQVFHFEKINSDSLNTYGCIRKLADDVRFFYNEDMENWKDRLAKQYRARLDELEEKFSEDEAFDFGKIEGLLIEEEKVLMKELLDESVRQFSPSDRTG